jgi:phosphoenolpyruvate-protein kinase (PTS system EI component)
MEARSMSENRILDAAAQPSADPWRDAVGQMLATTEQTASDDPRESLNRLIDWHVSVAMDPLVSSDARALVQRGRDEAQPSAETLRTLLAECVQYVTDDGLRDRIHDAMGDGDDA